MLQSQIRHSGYNYFTLIGKNIFWQKWKQVGVKLSHVLQEGTSLFSAYSFCLISKYPYFTALKDCLSWWDTVFKSSAECKSLPYKTNWFMFSFLFLPVTAKIQYIIDVIPILQYCMIFIFIGDYRSFRLPTHTFNFSCWKNKTWLTHALTHTILPLPKRIKSHA